ncbi:MAG: hypothetical protein JWP55_1183, partial [Mycobacterium sp.]|nr:hypothetical protein [Mycobacterium sp.]
MGLVVDGRIGMFATTVYVLGFAAALAADVLPTPLRFLTEEGRVETDGTTRYFPQRLGLPDDTGGYMYSPDASPLDSDLYGIFCRSPIPLG